MRARPRASTPMDRWCCWTIRTARCGIKKLIAEGLALIDKAMRHRASGPYQIQAAIAALHARAATPDETGLAADRSLYGALEIMQPSPVSRSTARSRIQGARAPPRRWR